MAGGESACGAEDTGRGWSGEDQGRMVLKAGGGTPRQRNVRVQEREWPQGGAFLQPAHGEGAESSRETLSRPRGARTHLPGERGAGRVPSQTTLRRARLSKGRGRQWCATPPPRGDSRVRGPGHRCKPAARKGSRPQNGAEGPAAAEPPSNPHQEDLQEAAPLSPSQGGG